MHGSTEYTLKWPNILKSTIFKLSKISYFYSTHFTWLEIQVPMGKKAFQHWSVWRALQGRIMMKQVKLIFLALHAGNRLTVNVITTRLKTNL